MNETDRLHFAVEHVTDKSVFILPRADWERFVHADGRVTDIEQIDLPMGAVRQSAVVVACAASGVANPSPGIDLVRLDLKDEPYIYNTDHYRVLEDLKKHSQFDQIIKVARVDFTPELDAALKDNVFIVGPERLANHWVEEIPDYIAQAEKKHDSELMP